jgi:hypothetical protein
MAISLPKAPDGEQYEDFVIACVQVLGNFVEPRLLLREGKKDVLELDAVATPLGEKVDARVLYEAKKHAFRFSDAFKLFGQRTYLGIGRAVLVSLEGTEDEYRPTYVAKGKELGVEMCHLPLPKFDLAQILPKYNSLGEKELAPAIETAWYGNIARRLALAALFQKCREHMDVEVFRAIRTYEFNVRAAFFLKEPIARAEALYDAYFADPQLTWKAIEYIAETTGTPSDKVQTAIWTDHEFPWAQSILDLECTGRIAIFKNGYDDSSTRGEQRLPTVAFKVLDVTLDVPKYTLPGSFRRGLAALKQHAHAARLPVLFQTFYNLFGGFIAINDKEELELMERFTGIPAGEVIDSLCLFDSFFAKSGETFFMRPKGEMLSMKQVPAFVRGTGYFLRQTFFKLNHYDSRYPKMGWLLSRWHNAVYHILEPHLSQPMPAAS